MGYMNRELHTTAAGFDPVDQNYSIGYETGHRDWSPFPRVNRLRKAFLDREYEIDVERFRNVTAAYQENEDAPTVLRCARSAASPTNSSSSAVQA